MSLIYGDPDVVIPGTMVDEDTQIEWRAMIMGVDSWFGYKSLTGWDDLPASDSADAPRPNHDGDIPGAMLAQNRIVTLDTQIWSPKDQFPLLRREFLKRFQLGQEEHQLTIRQHGETMFAWARVKNRSWPIDRRYFGGYPIASVQWVCSDPRKYSVVEEDVTLDVATSVGGLDYTTGGGLTYPLDYGTMTAGTSSVFNNGEVGAPLRFDFWGSLTPPIYIICPGNWKLGFDLPIDSTEHLEVDTRTGSVLLDGVDRYYTLTVDSDLPEDCMIPPGESSLQLLTGISTDSGNVDVYWRHTSM